MTARSTPLAAGIALSLALAAFAPAGAAEVSVGPDRQTDLVLTIYGNDTALVADERKVSLGAGETDLAFEDVSRQMQPETAMLVPADAGVQLLETSFAFDVLSRNALMEAAVGDTVRVVRVNEKTGEETVQEAEVLSVTDGLVLRVGDRIEVEEPGRIVFKELPPGLRERPTLLATLQNEAAKDTSVKLRYLTGGLNWKADYVANLNDAMTEMTLFGFATLTNTSGVAYRDAKLRLVAGTVNREQPSAPPQPMAMRSAKAEMAADAGFQQMERAAVGEVHLYSLPRQVSLSDKETKQVPLMPTATVPVKRTFKLEGPGWYHTRMQPDPQPLNPQVLLTFKNDKASKLDRPLPAGTVRVYGESGDAAVFLGEDRMEHTAQGEEVKLMLGRAFDVTAERRQTDFRTSGLPQGTFESANSVEIRNAKETPVEVELYEHVPGDWTMLEESVKHEKASANQARWTVTVPAGGKTTLTYRVRVQTPR